MSEALPSGNWSFRANLNDAQKLGRDSKPPSLAAFSPDIIPLDQISATPAEVACNYGHFIAHAIDRTEASTQVYLRALTSLESTTDNQTSILHPVKADLYAIENNLVAWPHLMQRAQHIGTTNLEPGSHPRKQGIASGNPIAYTPIPLSDSARHETLIATLDGFKGFSETAAATRNWRDLIRNVGGDHRLGLYNVMMADPCASQVKLTTKLELPENEFRSVDLYLAIEAVATPLEGIDVSLRVTDGSSTFTSIKRQSLTPSKEIGAYFTLPVNFSGTADLEIFNEDSHVFADYSSISIILHAINSQYSDMEKEPIIGAEHVIFDSNPRVKQFYKITNRDEDAPIFYFRNKIGETATSSRDGINYLSPDIQPVGSSAVKDPKTYFSNTDKDYSTADSIGITSNASNYVYLRGFTTTPHKGMVRLYLVPNTILLHPSKYSKPQYEVFDVDSDNNHTTALRSYDTTGKTGTNTVIFEVPFLLTDVEKPPAGSDHYCLVAECKPSGKPAYKWPHQDVGEFSTASEFAAWITNEHRVAQRNVTFVSRDTDVETTRTSFKIPKKFSASANWNFTVQVEKCPIGSAFSMDSSDPDIYIPKFEVKTSPQNHSVSFTGKPPGFNCQVVLYWYPNGHSVNSKQRIYGKLSLMQSSTSNLAKLGTKTSSTTASSFSAGSFPAAMGNLTEPKKFHVGESYPNVVFSSKSPASTGNRLRLGGAIKARRLTMKKHTKKGGLKTMLTASESGSDTDDDSSSDDEQEIFYETEIGRDSMEWD